MRSNDTVIKKCAEAFVPPMTESYERMMESTVSELKAARAEKSSPRRGIRRSFAAAAAVIAVLFAASAAVFTARPALAAEIPVVSGIVYAAAPEKAADASAGERIESLLSEVFGRFAACDYDGAERYFRRNIGSISGNYLAAAYLNSLICFGDFLPEGASAGDIAVSDIAASRKAYRYTADVKLQLVTRDGSRTACEECRIGIWENSEGMLIESIEMLSDGFDEFANRYEALFGEASSKAASCDIIPLDESFMSYIYHFRYAEGARLREDRLMRMLGELDGICASADEKALRYELINAELEMTRAEITPVMVSAEAVASELMYRYHLGAKTGEACGLADIMERNEQTDLFYWDALLTSEAVSLGVLKPLASVEKDSAVILETLEDDGDILKARFYVYTSITDGVSQGVGEEIILTLRRNENGFTVIGFDRDHGDGIYVYDLKPQAMKFKAEGCSWQEAGRNAYEAIHARLEAEAGL